jgi:hypothetical protein
MANVDLGPGYGEIARLAARDIRADHNGTLLYARAGERSISASLLKDVGSSVLYRDPSIELVDKLIEIREAEVLDRRWTNLQMNLHADTFDVVFGYEEMFDDANPNFDHREVIIKARYGDKQVDYSDP